MIMHLTTNQETIRCTYNDHAPHYKSSNRRITYEFIVATASPEQYETYGVQFFTKRNPAEGNVLVEARE
jgi:hypothetical protein